MDFLIVDNYKTFNWQKEENLVNASRRVEIDNLYQEELPTVYDIDLNEYNLIFTSIRFFPLKLSIVIKKNYLLLNHQNTDKVYMNLPIPTIYFGTMFQRKQIIKYLKKTKFCKKSFF